MPKYKPVLYKSVLEKLLRCKDIKNYEPRNGYEEIARGIIIAAADGNAKANEMILKAIGQNPDKPTVVSEDDPFTD